MPLASRSPWWLLILAIFAPIAARADVVPVATAAALRTAITNASAGDEIVLASGTYELASNVPCLAAGTAPLPIVVRAATAGSALVRFDALEGFRVAAPHWRFEDLVIEGVCASDDDCEHAFHIVGNADGVVIRRSVVRDFNAQIKANGDGAGAFPDDVVIEGNELYDTRARATANPVTKIDVVGGRRWIVRANTIHDYEKGGGDGISYAAFLKGNSRDGLFERNLVFCERDTSGGTRLGLSLGGGGSAPAQICEDGDCTTEHQNGTLRNNVIVGCTDVGIYLNRAAGTILEHNTLYDTAGIDVRFAAASAAFRNNLLSGAIRNRDGGSSTSSGDLTQVPLASFGAWFADPAAADFSLVDGSEIVDQGVAAPLTTNDFCGTARSDGTPDVGAVEYGAGRCDTTVGGGISVPEPGAVQLGAGALVVLVALRRVRACKSPSASLARASYDPM
jgi:parallel beta-helix repeat protein